MKACCKLKDRECDNAFSFLGDWVSFVLLDVRASVARLPDSPINVACPPHLHSISSVKGDQTSAAADSLLFLESIKALDLVIDRKRSYHIAVSELVSPKMGIVRSGYGYFRSSHVVLYLE